MKSVAVIPLVESRARDTLKALAFRNHSKNRPSLVPPESLVSIRGSLEDTSVASSDEHAADTVRVKFASEDQVKIMTPRSNHGFEQAQSEAEPNRSPSPSPSVVSTPSSELSVHTGNIAKALADRLSFWNRMSKPKVTAEQPASIDSTLAHGDNVQTDGDKSTFWIDSSGWLDSMEDFKVRPAVEKSSNGKETGLHIHALKADAQSKVAAFVSLNFIS